MIKFFIVWYLVGFCSMVFWSYKANKKWGLTVLSLIWAHLGFYLWAGVLGPLASIPGYICYEISKTA